MNRQECDTLIEAYVSWLRKGLVTQELRGSCELTTPFLDRHNDHVQGYAQKQNGNVILSDDGYTMADLRASGLDLNSPKRKDILQSVLNGFGVRNDGGRLVVEASPRNLGQRTHNLVQAMLAISDMFVMARARVETLFYEDVREYLDLKEVRYNERVKLAGKSGYDHAVDFLIPPSRNRPERLVQVINAPSKHSIISFLFSLEDTREGRGKGVEAFAFLNDGERSAGGDVLEALGAYSVHPILWSQRETSAQPLLN